MKKQYAKTKPECTVVFRLPKEAIQGATVVELVADFNEWKPVPMKKVADGSYEHKVKLATGQNYQFRYLLDGVRWENDWEADSYTPSPYPQIDNSVVSIPAKVKSNGKSTRNGSSAKKTPKTKADDLKKIEGIGPKIAKLLKEDGISSFQQLADAPLTQLQQVLENAGPRFRMHKPGTWSKQAALAAKGKWDQLKTLQDQLNGGK